MYPREATKYQFVFRVYDQGPKSIHAEVTVAEHKPGDDGIAREWLNFVADTCKAGYQPSQIQAKCILEKRQDPKFRDLAPPELKKIQACAPASTRCRNVTFLRT